MSAEYGQSRKLAFVNASMQYERSTETRSNDAANTRYDTYIHAIHTIHTYMRYIYSHKMRSCIHKMCCTHACNITCKTDAMHTCIHQMQYIHTYICTFIKCDTYKHATVTYKSYTRYNTMRCIRASDMM